MSRYQYSPLSDRLNNIRLLRILPAATEDVEIRTELLGYSLAASRKSRHSYEALSYVWGNIDSPRTILIGNDHLVVTPNLYAALIQLRDAEFPRVIWIDAIFINQADTHEKKSKSSPWQGYMAWQSVLLLSGWENRQTAVMRRLQQYVLLAFNPRSSQRKTRPQDLSSRCFSDRGSTEYG
jgi:arginase family enzyme